MGNFGELCYISVYGVKMMTHRVYLKILLVFLALSLGLKASSVQAEKVFIPQVPDRLSDYNNVDFYLLTSGVGPDLASRFGHTGIRIVDPHLGLDLVYNWGKFSFKTPGFGWKFFRGSLTYSMGVRTYKNDVSIYEEMGRALIMEPIRLTNQQKMTLYQKIAFNARPENRDFQYQYWYKNCSTIPRDLLDQTLHGFIYETFSKIPAQKVFRDYVRHHLSTIPFVASGLDIMMNGQIDRPISQWEEMFLPGKLREHLLSLPAIDDSGRAIDGQMLLGKSEVLVDRPENFKPKIPDYLVSMAPLGLGIFMVVMSRIRATRNPALNINVLKWLSVASFYYGILYGFIGLVLCFNWAFSGHSDGWANRNLLFFSPLDFYFVLWAVSLWREKAPVKDRLVVPSGITALCLLKLLIVVLYASLEASSRIGEAQGFPLGQDMQRVLLWFGSGTLLFLPLFLVEGVLRRPKKMTSPQQSETPLSDKKMTSLKTP
jgi:hypothetical protein